ncbi:MAG: TonB-dependent receptor [Bacteroidota bacterium]|nr:TonB-dependent receptor [Bacteroidota bacterium]
MRYIRVQLSVQSLVWTVLFLGAFAAPLLAQSGVLRGRVTDTNGNPLIGANVAIRGTVLGAATDSDGRYLIRRLPAGTFTVQCSMIGYARQSVVVDIAASAEREQDFRLVESMIETDEVIVTAGKHAQSFEEIPVSIATFDAQEIEARGIISLDNALRKVSGVNITEDQVNIRGSSGYSRALGSRVLLLVDGAPVLAGDAGEIKFDVVPMFAVDRIEVVKGAGSALYGSSALGGVINVLTRQPRERISRVRLYSGFWDEPAWESWKWWGDSPRYMNGIDLQHGDVHGDFSYLLTGGVRSDQSYRQNDDFARWNLSGRAWHRFDSERNLTLAVNHSENDRGNWVYWRDLEHALQPPLTADLSEHVRSVKTQASAQYRQTHSASFASMLRVNLYRTAFQTSSDTSDFRFRPTDQTQSTAWLLGTEWQGSMTLSDRNFLTFGVDASWATVDSRTFGVRDGITFAVYAQDELTIAEDWHLSVGARYDLTAIDSLDIDAQLNPRAGLTYTPWQGGVVRASYGWGFRSPSIAERYTSASAGGILTKPNPDLKAERSTSYEVGFKQDLPFGSSVDAALFWNDYDNLVEPLIDPADGRIAFRNITRARIIGYEIGVESRPFPDMLTLSASYTYLYPRDISASTVLKYRHRHLLYLSGDLRLGPVSFGADFRYLSRMENIDRELTLVIPDSEKRVAAYVTDLRLALSGAAVGLPLRLSFLVDNVFQYHYTEVVANIAPMRRFRLMLEGSF